MVAIALGVASAVVWGSADFLGGLKSRKLALLTVLLISQAAALFLLAPAVAIRGEGLDEGELVLFGTLAGVAGLVGLAAFYRGLAIGVMGVVSPISASAAAIPVLVGVLSGERPAALQLAGVVVAVAGVAVASFEPKGEGAPGPAGAGLARPAAATGVGLALLAALGFGFFFVCMDEAADHDLLWALLIARIASSGVLAVAALAARPSMSMDRADLRDLVAIGLLDVSANALFAAATTIGLVSVVAVLGSLYPVTTILLARFVLGERLRPVQRAGALTALAGVALISAG
jgi:drug/metabolite transporter (DMT)-like permease